MRPSSIAILAAIAVPSTKASSIMHTSRAAAINSIEKAKLIAIEHGLERRTTDKTDYSADSNNMGGAFMCLLLQGIEAMGSEIENDVAEKSSGECSMGCDDDFTNMIINCSDATESCDDTNEFCAKDNTLSSVVSLADMESTEAKIEMCQTYTKALYPELVGEKSCITIFANVDMNMAMTSEDANTDSNPEDMPENMLVECDFTVGDNTCQCSFCDDNNEITLSCPNLGFQTEECVNVEKDLDIMGADEDSPEGDGDISEGVSSVIRFIKIESSAAGVIPSIVTFSFVILTLAVLF